MELPPNYLQVQEGLKLFLQTISNTTDIMFPVSKILFKLIIFKDTYGHSRQHILEWPQLALLLFVISESW